MTRLHVDGHVSGIGTATGTRVVIGRWAPTTVVLIEFVDGHRVVLTSDAASTGLLVDPSTVADTRLQAIAYDEVDGVVTVDAGDLEVTFAHGAPTVLGRGVGLIPAGVPAGLATMVTRVALGVGAPGHRVLGHRPIASVSATWKSDDLGDLADLTPPVPYALGRTPTAPSTLDVTTERPDTSRREQ